MLFLCSIKIKQERTAFFLVYDRNTIFFSAALLRGGDANHFPDAGRVGSCDGPKCRSTARR